MPIPQEQINNWFTYHSPTPEQLVSYAEIRTAAKIFAETINKHVPDSADKTAAFRLLRESVMTANAAIACYVEQKRPTIAELETILNSKDNPPVTVNPDGSITAL